MKKNTSSFVCQECGYESPQWYGKCPECQAWNTLKEFKSQKSSRRQSFAGQANGQQAPVKLAEIKGDQKFRTATLFSEVDRVLGGGMVEGAVMLLAGDPGVGKSTLLLQTALDLCRKGKIVLYISGEESPQQIKLRADRLDSQKAKDNLLLLTLTDTDQAVAAISDIKPDFVIVDSIQTMESQALTGLAGSVGQVRYAAFEFIKVAKNLPVPIVIVGHVTKEGTVAGPMILSHMVDVVLFLEGERTTGTRILRSFKNRFGPVDEVGIFAMAGEGMQEITTPEQLFLDIKRSAVPGSLYIVTLEGSRAFLVELQALVVSTRLPLPRRVASGIDPKRLELLLAVLQKHAHLPLGTMDVFVNVAGGMKLSDPSSDLGVCLSLFSSLKNIALPKTVGIAEVGLLGELRPVPNMEKRVKEAERLGFSNIITAKTHTTLQDVIKSVGKG